MNQEMNSIPKNLVYAEPLQDFQSQWDSMIENLHQEMPQWIVNGPDLVVGQSAQHLATQELKAGADALLKLPEMVVRGVLDLLLRPECAIAKGVLPGPLGPPQPLPEPPQPLPQPQKEEDLNLEETGSTVSLVEACFPLMLQTVVLSMPVILRNEKLAKLEKSVYGIHT